MQQPYRTHTTGFVTEKLLNHWISVPFCQINFEIIHSILTFFFLFLGSIKKSDF